MKNKSLYLALLLVTLFGPSCQKESDEIIDTLGGLPPTLYQAVLTPDKVRTDTVGVNSHPSASDTLHISVIAILKARPSGQNGAITELVAQVFRGGETDPIQRQTMFDNGVRPDVLAGDNVYTSNIGFDILRQETGRFRFEFQAVGSSGLTSNKIITDLVVERSSNQPPVLSGLLAPDTLVISTSTALITLSVRASDPDGSQDISRVQFDTYRPDGSPSSGNPFQMYDDGKSEHGDATASDGMYSLVIQLPPSTTKGTYRFEFQAFDQANAGSNMIVHSMVVR